MADPSAAPLPDGDAQTPQHDAAAVTNGTTNGNVDVEMKEEMSADQQQQQRQELPTQPNPHGSATRVYLNQNVTPHLLEGMKRVALLEPEKPLKWLSDFLAEKSREHERD
ncbi:hypothetical protein SLS56_002380 [Neofusicoccum ribis]|uniref:COMPASS complex subunit Sdc1 n=1 Tax=Neofusicoccum ribis TaxID=45134 RepID=A0ABR3T455_9PEZI